MLNHKTVIAVIAPVSALILALIFHNMGVVTLFRQTLVIESSKIMPLATDEPRHAYTYQFKRGISDTNDKPYASRVQIIEDGVSLKFPHSLHDDIRNIGKGRYSHWGEYLIFSSSDNSDPRHNGRRYEIVFVPLTSRPILDLSVAFLSCLIFGMIILTGLPMPTFKTRANIIVYYAACLVIPILLYSKLSHPLPDWQNSAPSPAGGVFPRVAYYKENAAAINVVFFGDSRTFTDVHPHIIDPLLGLKTYNLAAFSNWVPVQYVFLKAFVDSIPPSATLVWSVGHQNFFTMTGPIRRVWPIPLYLAPRYLAWGISPAKLYDNIFYFNPYLSLLVRSGDKRKELFDWLDRPALTFSKPGNPATSGTRAGGGAIDSGAKKNKPSIEDTLALYCKMPYAGQVNAVMDGKLATSVAIYTNGGSYLRIELEPEYFRAKQSEIHKAKGGYKIPEQPSPEEFRIFLAILEMLKAKNVNVIVNELEEAPHAYYSGNERKLWREFMRQNVKPVVEKYGYPYVVTNLDALSDDDYFDYNHLNSKGSEKYNQMLAEKLLRIIPIVKGRR